MSRIVVFVAALLFNLDAPAQAQTQRIPVAYSAVSASQSAFYLTKEAGYFEKHGLFVDPVYVASGTKVAPAMIAGEFPVALAGGTVVNANLAGGDIVIFGGWSMCRRFTSLCILQSSGRKISETRPSASRPSARRRIF
jgi:ABC-type nitrate/sulfonate/bicarbonate transport system substrate-binding protein